MRLAATNRIDCQVDVDTTRGNDISQHALLSLHDKQIAFTLKRYHLSQKRGIPVAEQHTAFVNIGHRLIETDDVFTVELLRRVAQDGIRLVHNHQVLLVFHVNTFYRYRVSIGTTGIGHRPSQRVFAFLSNKPRSIVIGILQHAAYSLNDVPFPFSTIDIGSIHPRHRPCRHSHVRTSKSLGRHLYI